MVDEWFTDAQRRLVLELLLDRMAGRSSDLTVRDELGAIVRIMSGADTALFARRAYPSRGEDRADDAGG